MKGDRLPAVLDLEPLPYEGAVLLLDDGTRVAVSGQDHPALLPDTSRFGDRLMTYRTGPNFQAKAYDIPARLAPRLAWALACRPHFVPVLLGIEPDQEAATFTALQNEEHAYTLTVPLASLFHLTFPIASADPGAPLLLTVSETPGPSLVSAAPVRIFFFRIYPETPRGAECLAALEAFGVSG